MHTSTYEKGCGHVILDTQNYSNLFVCVGSISHIQKTGENDLHELQTNNYGHNEGTVV